MGKRIRHGRRNAENEGQSMKDDDETEDMLFSFIFIAVTILTVLFSVASVGLIIWSWL